MSLVIVSTVGSIVAAVSAFLLELKPAISFHLHELRVRFDWHFITVHSGDRVLFLDDNNRVRRGVLFNHTTPSTHGLYVAYLRHDLLANRTETAGTFVLPADQHLRWTYGWKRENIDALLVAEALR